jgi:hypothetical protein
LKVPVMPRTESYGTFSPAPVLVFPSPRVTPPVPASGSPSPTPTS